MGHKVNALSFRLKKRWDSLYFFKDKKKLNNFILQDISIRKYISQVCFHQKKIAYNFKIFRCSDSLFLFFKIYPFMKYSFLKNQKFKKLRRKKENKSKKLQTYLKLPYIKNLNIHLSKNICNFFKIKKVFIFSFKSFTYKKRNNRFIKIFFKNLYFQKKFLNIANLVSSSLLNKSSKLLSLGISEFFKKEIKHNQFIRLLNRVLFIYFKNFFILKKKKLLKGYRIEIKGKINGKPRKKKKIICSGPMPFSSVDSNITYFFSESFTKYGTFGIKVWLLF